MGDWPYDPATISARWILGADGKRRLQLRLDLGILQMESTGRPDGLRPHEADSLLDHYENLEQQSGTDPQGVLMIAQGDEGWMVLTGNFMSAAEVNDLRSHLDRVNGCGPDQLRELYKTTLNNGHYGPAGGGGLGLIDIARKSGRKLEYGFVPLDGSNAFFSLNVNVTS